MCLDFWFPIFFFAIIYSEVVLQESKPRVARIEFDHLASWMPWSTGNEGLVKAPGVILYISNKRKEAS